MTRPQANDETAAIAVRDATGTFLAGGNQLRLSSTIGDTRLAEGILERFQHGAVVAGTSAGASAMSSHMIAFGALRISASTRRSPRGLRRDHCPRGPEPAWAPSGRDGRQRRRGDPGDLVVRCVDDAIAVHREAMSASGSSRGGTAFTDPGELEAPGG